nr:hypothetical protein [Tanacetum cinerariifolium]
MDGEGCGGGVGGHGDGDKRESGGNCGGVMEAGRRVRESGLGVCAGEGDWKSWVRWWSREKWGRWCCKWWWEKRLGMNSVHLNVGGRQS